VSKERAEFWGEDGDYMAQHGRSEPIMLYRLGHILPAQTVVRSQICFPVVYGTSPKLSLVLCQHGSQRGVREQWGNETIGGRCFLCCECAIENKIPQFVLWLTHTKFKW